MSATVTPATEDPYADLLLGIDPTDLDLPDFDRSSQLSGPCSSPPTRSTTAATAAPFARPNGRLTEVEMEEEILPSSQPGERTDALLSLALASAAAAPVPKRTSSSASTTLHSITVVESIGKGRANEKEPKRRKVSDKEWVDGGGEDVLDDAAPRETLDRLPEIVRPDRTSSLLTLPRSSRGMLSG